MKHFLFLSVVALTIFSCNAKNDKGFSGTDSTGISNPSNNPSAAAAPTTIQLLDSVYNFGTITEGAQVEYSYRFKNTGTQPLVITNAVGSCGCTVAEKPEQPILPGEIGFMKVKFNSENRVGQTHKTVTVSANVEPMFPELLLTGEVLAKKS